MPVTAPALPDPSATAATDAVHVPHLKRSRKGGAPPSLNGLFDAFVVPRHSIRLVGTLYEERPAGWVVLPWAGWSLRRDEPAGTDVGDVADAGGGEGVTLARTQAWLDGLSDAQHDELGSVLDGRRAAVSAVATVAGVTADALLAPGYRDLTRRDLAACAGAVGDWIEENGGDRRLAAELPGGGTWLRASQRTAPRERLIDATFSVGDVAGTGWFAAETGVIASITESRVAVWLPRVDERPGRGTTRRPDLYSFAYWNCRRTPTRHLSGVWGV